MISPSDSVGRAERLLFVAGRNLSKAQNPRLKANHPDRAGSSQNQQHIGAAWRGRRGMAVIRAVRARCIPALPLPNNRGSACLTSVAYPDIVVAPRNGNGSRKSAYLCFCFAWRNRFASEPAAPRVRYCAIQLKVMVVSCRKRRANLTFTASPFRRCAKS